MSFSRSQREIWITSGVETESVERAVRILPGPRPPEESDRSTSVPGSSPSPVTRSRTVRVDIRRFFGEKGSMDGTITVSFSLGTHSGA